MHGIYTLQSLNQDSTAPLSRKTLVTFGALVSSLIIIGVSVSIVFLQRNAPSHTIPTLIQYIAGLLAIFGALILVFLLLVIQPSLAPLNELISWAKQADNLETIPIPPNVSREIAEIYEAFNLTLQRLRDRQKQEAMDARERALLALASQVAHDIRSPLSALSLVSDGFSNLPEERRVLIRSAITRIQDIANNLLSKYRMSQQISSSKNAPSIELLSSLTENLLSEKRAQFRLQPQLEIIGKMDQSSYGLFSQVQASEYKIVLSNLINNSSEAICGNGKVVVQLKESNGRAQLTIQDTGKGIPASILHRLLKEKVTYGKVGGSGLGLVHARQYIESWGGQIAIESTLGVGTLVTITLPKAPPPPWFLPQLQITPRSTVVVVDDDPSIHHTWDKKLSEIEMEKNGISVRHFFNGRELSDWIATADTPQKTICLMDYEFIASKQNGLHIIETLGIESLSVLVTSRAEESGLIADADRLGVPILPKSMVRFVPMVVNG